MNLLSRKSVGVGAAAAVLSYLLLTAPPWLTVATPGREKDSPPPRSGGDPSSWTEVEPPSPEILQRIQLKRHLARELAQGRLTLLEAAARFRDLSRGLPEEARAYFRDTYPGHSDAERYCRQVIRCVEGEIDRIVEEDLHLRHPEADAILARLRHDLEQHLDAGTLVLAE